MKIKKNLDLFFLIFLFISSLFLRVYKIEQRMAFGTDQGIDLLKVWQKIEDREWYYLGPKASVSKFHMAPFFYYLITPAVLLGRFNPVSPALFVALIESFTPPLIFLFCRKFFSRKTAFFASLLHAVSPLAITFSSFAWNPNTIPFFTILILYFLFSFRQKKKEKYFVSAFIIYSLAAQLHYQMVIFGFFVFFIFLLSPPREIKSYFKMFLAFLVAFSPYFYYELTHQFYNLKAIYFFFSKEHASFFNRVTKPDFLINFMPQFFAETIGANNLNLGRIIFFTTMLGMTLMVFNLYSKMKKEKIDLKRLFNHPFFLWFVFVCLNLLGLRIYKGDKLSYYLAFMFIVPAVSLGIVLARVRLGLVAFLIFAMVLALNLRESPIFKPPDLSLREKEDLTQKIMEIVANQKYTLEIPSRFYNAPVRYLLTYKDNAPTDSYQANLGVKLCFKERNCEGFEDEGKKDIPEQLLQRINFNLFSPKAVEEVEYKDFYIYIFKKII
jgi:4-amino-4-deoxy-L-arabinose transferase-like glycosyltransferase